MDKTEKIITSGKKYAQETYKQFPIVLSHGEGSHLWDTEGKRYIDFGAGIAVNALGYNHTKQVEAITEQAKKLLHCSNLYWNEPSVKLAETLATQGDLKKVYFANSGTEANEAAIKLARKYSSLHYNKEGKPYTRTHIISMQNSFHGRSYGSLSLTGQEKYHKGFYPLLPGISYGEFNNLDSVADLITEDTCAIIVEPIQGESGIRPATKEFLQGLRKLADDHNLVLIFDEVQCGIGRLGTLFAYQHFGVTPDIVTLAKGLGGGVPIGAMLASERVNCFAPGDHAGTYCGNPLVTASAQVVIEALTEQHFLGELKEKGKFLKESLQSIAEGCPLITEVRGAGLMLGVELTVPAAPVVSKAMELGLLIIPAGEHVVRFVPPLVITKAEITEGLTLFAQALTS